MTEKYALTIFRTIQKCRHQALHTNDCGNCERCQYYLEQEQIDGAVALAISALEKQEQDRWIPVTDRLPEEDTDVLVTVHFLGLKQTHSNGWNDHIKPSFYVDIAKHYSGEWCSTSDEYKVARSRHIVTAWRPLSEAYMEEEA